MPPCADLKNSTMDTSLSGALTGQASCALFPSTAITSTICAAMEKKEEEEEKKRDMMRKN